MIFSLKMEQVELGSWPDYNIDNIQFPNEMKVDYNRVYQP